MFTQDGKGISDLLREYAIVLVNLQNGCYRAEKCDKEFDSSVKGANMNTIKEDESTLRTTPTIGQQPMLRKQPSPSEVTMTTVDDDFNRPATLGEFIPMVHLKEEDDEIISEDEMPMLPRPMTPPLPPQVELSQHLPKPQLEFQLNDGRQQPKYTTLEKKSRAALILQSTYRGYALRNFIIQQDSCIILQTNFRRLLAQKEAAIQTALDEERRVKNLFERKKAREEEVQSGLRRDRELMSALRVQSMYRGFIVRKRLCDIEEDFAVILLQVSGSFRRI